MFIPVSEDRSLPDQRAADTHTNLRGHEHHPGQRLYRGRRSIPRRCPQALHQAPS